MNADREARLASTTRMSESVARDMLESAVKEAKRQRLSSGRIIMDLALSWANQLQSTVAVVAEIHNQKPSERRSVEAIAAMRLLATAAAGLAAASAALVIETQVEVDDLSVQLFN